MKKIFWKLRNEDMNPTFLFYLCAGSEVEASCLLGANNDDSVTTLYVLCEYSETTINRAMAGLH
jgi:hypothetical protein